MFFILDYKLTQNRIKKEAFIAHYTVYVDFGCVSDTLCSSACEQHYIIKLG